MQDHRLYQVNNSQKNVEVRKMEVNYSKKVLHNNERTALTRRLLGEQGKAFTKIQEIAFQDGAISQKQKELTAFGIALGVQDIDTAICYLDLAIKSGALPQEIKEITSIVLVMTGSVSLIAVGKVTEAAEHFFFERWYS